jgi:hypothetical protein
METIYYFDNCKKCKRIYRASTSFTKENVYSTRFCSQSCANSNPKSAEQKKKISEIMKLKSSWYKDGRSKDKFCLVCGKTIRYFNKYQLCRKHMDQSNEFKKTLSNSLKGKTGGYRKGGGRSNGGYYKKFHFDSPFEIEVAKFLDENNINWKRNTKRFYFIWNNKKTYYIPDFYFTDIDVYLETKGYYWADKKQRILCAVKTNNLKWIELMQKQEWAKDKNILLEKLKLRM